MEGLEVLVSGVYCIVMYDVKKEVKLLQLASRAIL